MKCPTHFFFLPSVPAEHFNKIVKPFMNRLGTNHTPEEAEEYVARQLALTGVLHCAYEQVLPNAKSHRHRTDFENRVARATDMLLETKVFLGPVQNDLHYDTDLFPSLVSIYKSVDELGMYKRFREPIKAHQQEMTRIHNNVIDPRHKLLAALHARARQD